MIRAMAPRAALPTLPADAVESALAWLMACDLVSCSRVCHQWKASVASVCVERCSGLQVLTPMPPASRQLWVLAELERLARWIGYTLPSHFHPTTLLSFPWLSHSWQSKWVDMNMEECHLTGQSEWAIRTRFEAGGEESIQERVQQEQPQIMWLLGQGWSRENAEAHALLSTYCNAAIGESLKSRSVRFGPGAFAVCAGLTAAALRTPTPAPHVFFNLFGFAGLETQDSAWRNLRRRPGPPRTKRNIITKCVACGNTADDRTFPATDDGTCAGFHKPTVVDGRIEYQLQVSAIVCFRSREPDALGTLRSLVPTCATNVYDGTTQDAGETVYELPPLAQVHLIERFDSGEWRANGAWVQQPCYVVEVEWGPHISRSESHHRGSLSDAR